MKRAENTDLESMLAAAREQDAFAFEFLLNRYRPMLNAAVRGVFDGAVTDEALSEAYEAFHDAATHWTPGRFTTFGLYAKICVYRRLRKYRSSLNRVLECRISDTDADPVDMESEMVAKDTYERLMRSIASISSDMEYRVFSDYIDGRPVRETAARLGKTEKQVCNARARLLGKIRQNRALFAEFED